MNELIIWTAITITCLFFAFMNYKAGYDADFNKRNKYFRFLEFFRYFANYFVTLSIVYYFVFIREPISNQNFSFSDFIFGTVFLIGLFGWLPFFVKNITEGINSILNRVLNK